MRSLLLAAAVALGMFAPAPARAQVYWSPGLAYNSYYYAPTYTYPPAYTYTPYYSYGLPYYTPSYSYVPGYTFGPTYSTQPYVWSGRYQNTPFGRTWGYERYYPGTNQYFYRYGYRPWY